MATQFNFNGNTIKIPGVYTNTKSGIKNPSQALPYGNVLIIDTGSGATWGGGAGIDGELAANKKAIYEFDNIADYRNFHKGGLHWLLAEPLFRPAGTQFGGASKVYFIKAATTTAAEIAVSFTGDGGGSESVVNGGDFTIQILDEGVIGNGVLNTNSELKKGYAIKMEAGTIDTNKFVLKFYRGGWTGTDQNNLDYNGISDLNAKPVLIETSPEFDNVSTLYNWMLTDASFAVNFKLKAGYTTGGDGSVDYYDLLDYDTYTLASGGTESYAGTALLDTVLTTIKDMDVSFILSDKYAANATATSNDTILEHIVSESVFKPQLVIGGGNDENGFASSLAAAAHFDSDSVTLVHGGIKKISKQGLREYDSIYKAAAICGREAGLAPQIPITFKNIKIDQERHDLTDKQITQALDAGVVVTKLQDGSFDIVKGINTLQENTFLVNEDGSTHSLQIKRIARQLNNEIRVNSKKALLKNPLGVNRNTLSEEDLKDWLKGYLLSKKAKPGQDNLIIGIGDITVSRTADAYSVEYEFTPNSEISFLFFTGLIINI